MVPLFSHHEWWVVSASHGKIVYAEYPPDIKELMDTWDWEYIRNNPEDLYIDPSQRKKLFQMADENLVADTIVELQSADGKITKIVEIRICKQGPNSYITCGREIPSKERRAAWRKERKKKGGVAPKGELT